MDKLLTLTAPVPGPLFLFTGHPDHGQRESLLPAR